jgi:hypothetical protein
MNKSQEAFANSNRQLGHLLVQIDTYYQSLPEPIRKAYDSLGSAQRYGCHVDLEPGQEPDDCEILTGSLNNCVYAKEDMRPEQCKYWKPIMPKLNVG